MIFKRLKVTVKPSLVTNCYIIIDEYSRETMLVDPGAEPEKIINVVKILDGKLKYIALTHCHVDHIGAVQRVKNELGGKTIIHRIESENIKNPDIVLFDSVDLEDPNVEIDSRVDEDDIIHIGDIEFKIIHTPGHTNGSMCLYCERNKLLLSGDTLFSGTWGRTDLPTSSFEDIMLSITNKLMILPEDTIVYPGHGNSSIIKEETRIYLDLKPKLW
ncbi:MAG: MBL fold metallo-hydrolase [Oscillospiraceae bacterium]|nr:MBL fold metallo-hydrolase [Oscillospiraceae bacterium]